MKRLIVFLAAMSVTVPAFAQHVHMEEAQATAPQATPPPAAPGMGQGGRQAGPPPIDVPWDDSIPAGTMEHAARALKESPRHGEWVDIKMADGTALKSWVVYPERSTKSAGCLTSHARSAISSRRMGSLRSSPISCRARGRTAAGPSRLARVSDRPSRGLLPLTSTRG